MVNAMVNMVVISLGHATDDSAESVITACGTHHYKHHGKLDLHFEGKSVNERCCPLSTSAESFRLFALVLIG